MSQNVSPSVLAHSWDDPTRCPFCLAELESAGAGFVDHIDESPVCRRGFEMWRDSVSEDVAGGWPG